MKPCCTLQFIQSEKSKAERRLEHAEVARREREEREHLEKCVTCAASIEPLYVQLWPSAQIGVDVYIAEWSNQ